jgi:hypothetical protein
MYQTDQACVHLMGMWKLAAVCVVTELTARALLNSGCYCVLQADSASATEALMSRQRESERQQAAAAAATLKVEVR